MMNDIVIGGLEIIFGIWLLNLFLELLFDIDVVAYVKAVIDKFLFAKKDQKDD